MKIVISADAPSVGALAGAELASAIRTGPDLVLRLATGTSPLGIYQYLADRVAAGELDCSRLTGFALDEYIGIPLSHPESYAEVLRRRVTEPLRLDPARVHVPDGRADDLLAASARYESAIDAAGGVELQILGIGSNGHIGFNEPPASLASLTRPVELSAQTRKANARFFDVPSDVPTLALTQGLATILRARQIVLVAQGAEKRAAIAAAIEGPVSPDCPASALQLHGDVTIFLDADAAADLQHRDDAAPLTTPRVAHFRR